MHYLPPDRKNEGLVLAASASDNIALGMLGTDSLRGRRAVEAIAGIARTVGLDRPMLRRLASQLSGGNQQKVLFGKGFGRDYAIYVFDEPTVGVDMGTRAQLYRVIKSLAESGKAVVVISSDLQEAMSLSHRLLIFSAGRISAELRRPGDQRGGGASALLRAQKGRRVSVETTTSVRTNFRAAYAAKLLLMRVGVLPFFLVAALVVFTLASSQFLTAQNIVNVARQSVYLVLVSLGQMIVLLTGGFDLAVGTTIALTSVISAMIMISVMAVIPDSVGLIIAAGCLGAIAVALLIGLINGTGVAVFGVSPFIMTLGVQSVGAGVALFLTGGVPVTGFPHAFGDTFGFGRIFGVPVPVAIAIIAIAVVAVFLYGTRFGRHLYAVGGNVKAAKLSGINTTATLLIAYAASALLASIDGLLLTARVEFGRGESRRNHRAPIDRRLRHRRRFASRRHWPRRRRRARRVLHRAHPERHGPHADRIVHADGSAWCAAHTGGDRRPDPLPPSHWGELTGPLPGANGVSSGLTPNKLRPFFRSTSVDV